MNLNMILSVISIFVLLTLSACSQEKEEYNFYGQSSNWVAKYKTEMSESSAWADISFEYIGEESPPSTFGYNLKSHWFEISSKEVKFNHPNKNINSGNSECTGPPINSESCNERIDKDTKLEAVLEWNGKSEVILLNRQ
ncbi:hypothetical protein AAGS61_09560 [Lysinibacillus sp. KU-BSD001]|uniref:hypothetical protein n=1 Tax=Lysinibacillus sp. KU-BSD001 TaxID=3141328 RepID=UPI0036EAF958